MVPAISAFKRSLEIPELKKRIFYMLAIIVVIRLGSAITLPGVNPVTVQGWIDYLQGQGNTASNIATLLNVFSGGGASHCAIFGLGIMPYISASIMVQLLTAVVPKLSKLAREEGGRQKISQWTRYLAIGLCILQGLMMARGLVNPAGNYLLPQLEGYLASTGAKLVPDPSVWWYTLVILVMTSGTMLLMWLGDQITEKGIGNGVSLVISANIVSALPGALVQVWRTYITPASSDPIKAIPVILLILLLIAVIAGIIALTQAARRVSIQYAKRQIGKKVLGGQSTHLPLKINYSGVMPIIFAQAIILFPSYILNAISSTKEWGNKLQTFMAGDSAWFYLIDAVLIFFFSYFWVATMFQPTQISEDLKRNGGYIPGIRPGKPTADFLDHTMSRLTFAGAFFLTLIAVAPRLISHIADIRSATVTQFFGGTSILILVGVLLDMMRQMETFLLQRNYDGFLRKGKIRGRFDRPGSTGAAVNNLVWFYALGGIVILGAVCWYYIRK